ncbi:ComF family protein [Streptococcus halichoeri]|uniref:ComF family protein n=1 Tax=Streptococcus halichoeri TaxID=254785 RepID=UPI00135715C0|nr:ComF family protein [Streptococcus halichoeri]
MVCLLCGNNSDSNESLLAILLFFNQESYLCLACQQKFHQLKGELCMHCCKVSSQSPCQDCQKWQLDYQHKVDHLALYKYNQAMKDYFKAYKFQGDFLLRKAFIKPIRKALKPYQNTYHIIPVPLDEVRLNSRGFNQVVALLEEAKVPYRQVFGKHPSQRQSAKSRQERLMTENPFFLKAKPPKQILLVDDVYTTGATIFQLTNLLKQAGVTTIKSFSLAR